MLELDICKRFGTFNIELQCSIRMGFTAIFGASGSGKTSLLNMIAGLLHPDKGRIVWQDQILFDSQTGTILRPLERKIGYIFQESRLFPHLNIRENIRYGLNKVPKNERRFQEPDVIQQLGIETLLDRPPHKLSGGEKQRCALARALLASPSLLLMDEPMAALDRRTKMQFLHFLKRIQQEYQLPIVYVSHDVDNVLHFADNVLLMEEGKVVGQGKPREILSKIMHPVGPNRVEFPNTIAVRITEHRADDGLSVVQSNGVFLYVPILPAPLSSETLLSLRASDIMVSVQKPMSLGARNIVEGVIQHITRGDARVFLEVDVGFPLIAELSHAALIDLNIRQGNTVHLAIKALSVYSLSEYPPR